MKSSKSLAALGWLSVSVLVLLTAAPLLVVFMRSFQAPLHVREGGLEAFVWNYFSVDQYKQVMFHDLDYWFGFWNTVFLTLPAVALTILSATLAAYGLANLKRRSKKGILLYYIVLSLLPTQVLLVPNFVTLSNLGLIGNRASIVLTACFSPYYTYFLFRFCSQIPQDIFEAARIEGAGELQIYRRVALPQMKPGIWALVMIACADLWNMVEQPLVFLQDTSKYPLSILFRDMDFSMQYTGSILFSLPLLLLFYFSRKDFVKGIQG